MKSLRKTYSTFMCLDVQWIERRKALRKLQSTLKGMMLCLAQTEGFTAS